MSKRLKRIKEDAFGYCKALRKLVIPKSVTDVTRAFSYCSIHLLCEAEQAPNSFSDWLGNGCDYSVVWSYVDESATDNTTWIEEDTEPTETLPIVTTEALDTEAMETTA